MELQGLISGSRVLFGLFGLILTWHADQARSLIWCHFLAMRPALEPWLRAGLWLMLLLFGLLALGVAATPVAIGLLLLHLILFRVSTLYSLEQMLIHALLLYLTLVDSGRMFSLWPGPQGRLLGDNLLPEVLLAVIVGIVFLGAGWTKAVSPMWIQGEGVYAFFINVRNLIWRPLREVSRWRWLMYVLNHIVLAMELLLLPTLLLNPVPAGLLAWLPSAGFALAISTVFTLGWIGPVLSLLMLLTGWVLWHFQATPLLWALWAEGTGLRQSPLGMLVYAGLLLTVCACLWTVTVLRAPRFPLLRHVHLGLRWIARHAWGLTPVNVFSERNLDGVVVYRAVVMGADGAEHEPRPMFTRQGFPHWRRWLKPSLMEAFYSRLTEACEEADRWREISATRWQQIRGYGAYILAAYRGPEPVTHIRIWVMQMNRPQRFSGVYRYEEQVPWVPAFDLQVENGMITGYQICAAPILSQPLTSRDITRDSSRYNPLSP